MDTSDTPSTQKRYIDSAVKPTGHLFIVSAPSGAGKTTLCNAMRQLHKDLAYSVSYTTRPPRKGERQGREYHFITVSEFELGISRERWAEWAIVHGNYYGSCAQWIERTLAAGENVLMDIDLQGASQMMQHFPGAITIFIMPPSIAVLEKRLRDRGTDTPETIALRLANAKKEISQKNICKHVLVNDGLEAAKKQMAAILDEFISPGSI